MNLLHHFFEHQADIHPDHIALICQGDILTYKDIEQRSNQMAHWLTLNGVGPHKLVSIFFEKSANLYITMLAILKTGAAYLPICPEYPKERIEYILSQATSDLLLVNHKLSSSLETAQLSCPVINIDDFAASIHHQPTIRLDNAISPADLSYVIYTSGSTGHPKGVAVAHESIVNFVAATMTMYGIQPSDRVYQGFTIGFDASLEEIWLAFANGAALVVGTSASLHASESLSQFFALHHVTVFSTVPTMVAMLEDPLPTLRVLILGGEVCPQNLIDRFARPGLHIFNTYGPTETTVVATYAECLPGKSITIGQPLPNCSIYLLDENLSPVKSNEIGEIFIGGKCLARGYLNDPALTEKKFIQHPAMPSIRLYRTGDCGRFNAQGDLEYHGRLDNQIKLRGFRVELAEIEACLVNFPGVTHAIVTVFESVPGTKSLIAYVRLNEDQQLQSAQLHGFLKERLPDYMVPIFYERISRIPLTPHGKVDYAKLPKPQTTHAINKNYVAPRTELEQEITQIWQQAFKTEPISIRADFFYDLGGHSLMAAEVISRLRHHPNMKQLSTLDLYENPTIEKLAVRIEDQLSQLQMETATSSNHPGFISRPKYLLSLMTQSVGVLLQFILSSWQFLFIFLVVAFSVEVHELISLKTISLIFITIVSTHLILILLSINAKWLLLGRIKPGKHRLWSWFYVRFWFVDKLNHLTIISFLNGTPLINFYYRLMGAHIGKNCFIGTGFINAFDLFHLGDYSSMNNNVIAQGYRVENGWLILGNIHIGKNCFVGLNSVLEINTKMEDGACLGEHSMLPAGSVIGQNESFAGSPARLATVPLSQEFKKKEEKENLFSVFFSSLFILGLCFALIIYSLAILPGIVLLDYFCFIHPNLWHCLWAVPLSALLFIAILAAAIITIKKFFIYKLEPGCYKLQSLFYYQQWLVKILLDLSEEAFGALYATIYAPFWFRKLGAKIAAHSEISTMDSSIPDLVTIGEECFIADGAIVGGPRIFQGRMEVGPVTLESRVFVGNSAVVPLNTVLESNSLIGCLSLPPNQSTVVNNTAWLGSPALFLPKREIFAGFSEEQKYKPSLKLIIGRSIVDLIKIILQPTFFFTILLMQFIALRFLLEEYEIATIIFLFPCFDIAIILFASLLVIMMKWLIIGRYQAATKPAWSFYVWRSELVTGLYDYVLVKCLLGALLGTPFFSIFLRLLGAKIGKRFYTNSTYFSEFDLVHIDNNVCVNTEATIQTHLFEDRVMKMAPLVIKDGCSLGARSIVLYNTIMEKHASLADLSLLMKGEILPAYTAWNGIPAQYVGRK